MSTAKLGAALLSVDACAVTRGRAACAQGLAGAARASFSTDQAYLVFVELTSWKGTATAIAGGLGPGEPQWLDDDDVVVERP